MSRIPLIASRSDVSGPATEAFDEIVASRGELLHPFAILLHVPEVARHAARVGATLRWSSGLSDHDRELAILTTAFAHGCDFEVEAHLPLARAAGVREDVVTSLRDGSDLPEGDEAPLVGFARELCATSAVSDGIFDAVHDRLGDAGTVELTALVGYYTMLAFCMNSVGSGG